MGRGHTLTCNRWLVGFSWLIKFGFLLAPAGAQAQEVFAPPMEPRQFLALQADETIDVDGDLKEKVWQKALPITEFVQKSPVQGAPASYPTDVRVVFDNEALYIGVTCHQPKNTMRVQNLRRDFLFEQNDLFGVAIDGFLDKRNAIAFQTTPYGSQGDMELIDGSDVNLDWEARWSVRTKISDTYWTAEMAIPWRNLRYPAGADRLGVIFARNIRSRNEQMSTPDVPRVLSTYRMSYAGELRGIVPPPPNANVQLNPYWLRGQASESGAADDSEMELGGELKWAITPSTVLDLTLNTDFAQADVDRQVMNLERFSVFFPERRQFFLENANIFNASVTEWIRPFFSRRIGLNEAGRPIPLDGGLRLTSRSSREQFGVLATRQQALDLTPASQLAVARYSRNVSKASQLGGLLTYRRDDSLELGDQRLAENHNYTYTVDGLWRPSESFGIQGMLSASTDHLTGGGLGGQLWAFFQNNQLYISLLEYYDKDYNPAVGLELLDANYIMHSLAARYELRSEKLPSSIRSLNPGASAFVFKSSDDGKLLFAYAPIYPLRLLFQNGAQLDMSLEPNRQRLTVPFQPVGVEIAPGRYDYTRYRVHASTDQSAKLAAIISAETGNYFDGQLTTYLASGRLAPWPHLELSAELEVNKIRNLGVAAENKDTRMYSIDTRFALSPRLQLGGIYQWDSSVDRSVWNLRLSWEYRPLSYFYLVYNRNKSPSLNPTERFVVDQVTAKMTYLFET